MEVCTEGFTGVPISIVIERTMAIISVYRMIVTPGLVTDAVLGYILGHIDIKVTLSVPYMLNN